MKSTIIKIVAVVLAILAGLILLTNWATLSERAQGGKALQVTLVTSEASTPATRSIPLFPEPAGRMGGLRPHECPFEDGDPSGRPCVWSDSPTGRGYFIDSAEYLN